MAKKKTKNKKKNVTTNLESTYQQKAKDWLDVDLACHAVKVAKRQTIEAKIALLRAELREAEAEHRHTEAEISEHASYVEYGE